jgi:hypothetical protein
MDLGLGAKIFWIVAAIVVMGAMVYAIHNTTPPTE